MASFENQTPLNPQDNNSVLVITKNIGGQDVEFEVQYQAHHVSQQKQFTDAQVIRDMQAAGHFHVDDIRVNGVYLPSGIRVKDRRGDRSIRRRGRDGQGSEGECVSGA